MALIRRGFAIACVALAGAVGACGIDEVGLATGDSGLDVIAPNEGGGPDVVPDVPLPPSCATTDLSCLGFDAGAPDGWSPYMLVTDGSCPSGDYTGSNWVTNATLAPGSCACTCAPQGSWSCPSTLNIDYSIACGTAVTVGSGQCQAATAQHIQGAGAAATSNGAGCVADAAAPAPQSDPVILCSAGCDAGAAAICSQPAGSRCIATDGVTSCPAGFTQHVVGASATGSCDGCTCTTASATCSAAATVYYGTLQSQNTNCSTSGPFTSQNLNLDGTCQAANGIWDSFKASWNAPPAVSCSPDKAGSGDAGVTAPKTVCCK